MQWICSVALARCVLGEASFATMQRGVFMMTSSDINGYLLFLNLGVPVGRNIPSVPLTTFHSTTGTKARHSYVGIQNSDG
jgi:hypothetical protein